MIDEFPILSIAAVRAIGDTQWKVLKNLDLKRLIGSDAMSEGLKSVGVETEEKKIV